MITPLYIEFDPLTTVDSLDTSLICEHVFQNVQPCTITRYEYNTRLVAIDVNVEYDIAQAFSSPTIDFTQEFVQHCGMDPTNYVTFHGLNNSNHFVQTVYILLLFMYSTLYIACIYYTTLNTKSHPKEYQH